MLQLYSSEMSYN